MRRRRIFRVPSLVVAVVMFVNIAGCSGGGGPAGLSPTVPPKADIVLAWTDEELAATVKSQYSRLKDLASQPGRATTIQLGDTNPEFLSMAFVKNAAAKYEHPRFVRQSTGEVVNLVWGMKSILPSIKGVDDSGKTLVVGGKSLEFPVENVTKSRGTADLVALGVKVAAVAFAVWLGAGVARVAIAATGWLAFNALVLGLVVAAGAVAVSVAKPILDFFGIHGVEDVKNIFAWSVESITSLLIQIKESLS